MLRSLDQGNVLGLAWCLDVFPRAGAGAGGCACPRRTLKSVRRSGIEIGCQEAPKACSGECQDSNVDCCVWSQAGSRQNSRQGTGFVVVRSQTKVTNRESRLPRARLPLVLALSPSNGGCDCHFSRPEPKTIPPPLSTSSFLPCDRSPTCSSRARR